MLYCRAIERRPLRHGLAQLQNVKTADVLEVLFTQPRRKPAVEALPVLGERGSCGVAFRLAVVDEWRDRLGNFRTPVA